MISDSDKNAVFRALADVFTFSEDTDFFDILSQRLAEILSVQHVVISRVDGETQMAYAHSFFSNGQHIAGVEYSLSGTPCEQVSSQTACHYVTNAAHDFPDDQMLVDLQVDSYMGYPLLDRQGDKYGLIAIMADKPFLDADLCLEVLRISGAQVAAELHRRSNESRMHELAFTDPVTGIANRTAFMHRIDREKKHADEKGEGLCLLVVNIRRFKEINDAHSHYVGDLLLAAVAERLSNTLSEQDFIARFSSDEFGILMPCTAENELPEAIERVKLAFSEPLDTGERLFGVEVRIGAAHYPSTTPEVSTLLQRASIALNHARHIASHSRIYDSSMSQQLLDEQQMLERLKLAINEEKLSLYYQPQFDVRTGKLCGAEALCRWHDEELGNVPPMQFIQLAEERGLIYSLGNWVVREAITQLQDWLTHYDGFAGTLSVNISALQFEDPYMANYLIEKTSDLPKGVFALELTESIMMQNPQHGMKQLQRLQDSGIGIAVDDFGTGYSSLSYLTQFPISVLKIDRTFIQKMYPGNHQHAIVTTIIAMAEALGLDTVAEGVETPEQEATLKALGCFCMQGFLRGKPVPANEFAERWLQPKLSDNESRINNKFLE
ncbi:histidine kinase [Aliidiomarina iranensis]|uniref:Histidine kinase n=1 Tax=Aliidiomarina iranensis TaxID=1434071 RepID=A0A432VZS5_9GAMM|nr:sensor domain-containing phosphodiesterase [Aliidiomarina iranensis]RUO22242.1 histidine kinase [Aliidiomarina iranensis]